MYMQGQDPITDVMKADMAIKNAIFNKEQPQTTVPQTTVTVPGPYVPPDVIVTVPVTERPATPVRILSPAARHLLLSHSDSC